MPELGGLDLIRELVSRRRPPADRPQILMMTAHATVESAIEAMRLGAFDYLQKPFEIDELLVVVNRALEHQRLRTAAPLPASASATPTSTTTASSAAAGRCRR